MPRYVWTEDGWVEAHTLKAAAQGIAIQSDFAEPLLCHADGRMHSSRSTYDAAVRAAGCEIVGKTEARKMQERGAWHGRLGMEPVHASLKRALREAGE
jgi:hypothetical protein